MKEAEAGFGFFTEGILLSKLAGNSEEAIIQSGRCRCPPLFSAAAACRLYRRRIQASAGRRSCFTEDAKSRSDS